MSLPPLRLAVFMADARKPKNMTEIFRLSAISIEQLMLV